MNKNKFASIESIIKVAKNGSIFILVDDESRENEGDLVFLGNKCTPKKINFMAKHGRGLICLALNKKQSERLGLKLMSHSNLSRFSTAFTVSIEAKKGVSTGISAFDRSKTILAAVKKNAKKDDIVSPGHIFPLVAKEGGVLIRAGHTEASVDLAKLSINGNSAVICEIMNDDGSMAKRDQLFKFAKKHNLKIAKIEDLISYRLKKESFINEIKRANLNLKGESFILRTFKNKIDNKKHLVITSNNLKKGIPRVRVIALNDDKVFKKNLLNKYILNNLHYIKKNYSFALVVIQSGMNEDMSNYIKFSKSDREFKSNLIRNYGVGAQIIKKLGLKKIVLVTKSKKRIVGLEGFDIKILKQEIFK